jgi:hypothetical protein
MRHLLSVVLSIILAPLIYVAAGFAALKLQEAHLNATIDWTAAEIGLGAGVVAGALYAVLVMARISPIGPLVAGLAYLGVTVWAFLNAASFVKAFDFKLLGEQHVLLQPVGGAGALLLAIPLIATVFSRRRWTTQAETGLPYDAAPAYSATPSSAAPAYGEPPATPAYGAPYPGESTYTPSSPAPTYAVPGVAEQPTYQPSALGQPSYGQTGFSGFTPAPTETTAAQPTAESPAFDSWNPYTPGEQRPTNE